MIQAMMVTYLHGQPYRCEDGSDYYQVLPIGKPSTQWVWVHSNTPLTSELIVVKSTSNKWVYEAIPEDEISGAISGAAPTVCPQ